MDGYSVWDEASRDYDAERALQIQATLRVAANDLTVFVAQSQSATEFGHRFALAAETVSRIAAENGVTESEVANHVYAQWKLLTAAEEDSDDSGPDTYCKNCGKSFNFNGQSENGHCPLCGSSNLSDIERKRFASKTAVGMAKCQDCGGSNDLSDEGKDYCSDCADETDPEMTHEAGKPTKGSPEPKPENVVTKVVNRVLFNGEPGFYGTSGESDENSRGPIRSRKWLDWDKAQKAEGDKTANLADSSCRSCDATGKTKDGKSACGNCGGMGIVPAEVNAPKTAGYVPPPKREGVCQGEGCGAAMFLPDNWQYPSKHDLCSNCQDRKKRDVAADQDKSFFDQTKASRRTAVSAIDPEYAAKHLEVMPAERKGKFDSDGYPKRGDLDCPNCGSKEMEEGGDGEGRVDDRQCPDCGHQEFPVEGMRTKIPSTLDPKKISYHYSKVVGLKDDEGWEYNDGSTHPAGDRAGHQVDALHDGEKVGHIKWLAEDSDVDGGPGAILDVRLGEAHQGQGLTNKLLGAARDAWKNGKANTRPYIRDDNDLGYWSSDVKNGKEWPSNKADEAEYEKSERPIDGWEEWHNKGQKGTTASRLNFNQASYKSISSNAKTSLEELRALVRQGAFDKISESNVPTPPADAHVKSTPDGGFQNPQEKLWSPVPGPPANNVMPTATDFNSANMDTANAVQSSLQKRVVAAVANQAIKDNPGLSVMAALALANETIDRFPAVIAEFTPLDFPPPTPPKNGPITDKFEKIRDELWSPSKKKKKDGEEDDDEDEDSGFSLNLPRRGPRHKKDPSEDTERPSLREIVKQVGPAWRQLKDELKPKQPESEPAPADDDPWL